MFRSAVVVVVISMQSIRKLMLTRVSTVATPDEEEIPTTNRPDCDDGWVCW